jgi:hypothetical protein
MKGTREESPYMAKMIISVAAFVPGIVAVMLDNGTALIGDGFVRAEVFSVVPSGSWC